MNKYLTLDYGSATTSDDPRRGVWYSAILKCGYWTDDWSKLSRHESGIPCCPHCGCVGMQMEAAKWLSVPTDFLASHPRYDEWLLVAKEQCGRKDGNEWMDRYQQWYKSHAED